MDVNVKGCFLLCKYAIPEMRKRGGGVIINNASVQGLQSQKLVPAYAASKGAVLSLTRNLALDYAEENIRAVAICPGSVDTPMLRATAALTAPDDPGRHARGMGTQASSRTDRATRRDRRSRRVSRKRQGVLHHRRICLCGRRPYGEGTVGLIVIWGTD